MTIFPDFGKSRDFGHFDSKSEQHKGGKSRKFPGFFPAIYRHFLAVNCRIFRIFGKFPDSGENPEVTRTRTRRPGSGSALPTANLGSGVDSRLTPGKKSQIL